MELMRELELLKGEKINWIDVSQIPCEEDSNEIVLKKKPLVSVIIITYNHENYIEKAIISTLEQKTSFPYEIIIAEDCSTDNTRKIIKKYQSKYPNYIRFIYSKTNVGITKNAIRADLKANGKYIAYCEGDDYWIDHYKLEKQVKVLESDTKIGMVFSRAKEYYAEKKQFKVLEPLKSIPLGIHDKNVFFLKRLKSSITLTTCTVMVRRCLILDAVNNHIVFKVDSSMMDMPRWFAASYKMKTFYMNDIMGVYVLHIDSVSNNWDLQKVARQGCVVLYGFLKSINDRSEYLEIEPKVFYRMISHAFHRRDKMLSFACQKLARKGKVRLSTLSKTKLFTIDQPMLHITLKIFLDMYRKLQ